MIDKLYKKYGPLKDGTVKLTPFARDLVSLSIILMKASFDEVVWDTDFNLSCKDIRAALALYPNTVNQSQEKVLESKKFPEWDNDVELPADIDQIQRFDLKIRVLEMTMLEALNRDLSIDLDYGLSILITNKTLLDFSIFGYFKAGFLGKNNIFDEFICKFILMLIAHQSIEEGDSKRFQDLLHAESAIIARALLEWEQIIGPSKYITPLFVSRIIKEYLHNNQNMSAFLQKADKLRETAISDFLRQEMTHMHIEKELISQPLTVNTPASEEKEVEKEKEVGKEKETERSPQRIRLVEITRLINRRTQLPKDHWIENLRNWENENWQLIKQIHNQLPDREKINIRWDSISVNQLYTLCKKYKIYKISESETTKSEAQSLPTASKSSLQEEFAPRPLKQSPVLAKIGILPVPKVSKLSTIPPASYEPSLFQGM